MFATAWRMRAASQRSSTPSSSVAMITTSAASAAAAAGGRGRPRPVRRHRPAARPGASGPARGARSPAGWRRRRSRSSLLSRMKRRRARRCPRRGLGPRRSPERARQSPMISMTDRLCRVLRAIAQHAQAAGRPRAERCSAGLASGRRQWTARRRRLQAAEAGCAAKAAKAKRQRRRASVDRAKRPGSAAEQQAQADPRRRQAPGTDETSQDAFPAAAFH